VETVVVLRRETEDGKTASFVERRLVLEGLAEESLDAEVASLDPDLGRFVDCLEEHGAAVGGRNEGVRIGGVGDGSSVGLEFATEELVERLCERLMSSRLSSSEDGTY
jgi:hypothetical protein